MCFQKTRVIIKQIQIGPIDLGLGSLFTAIGKGVSYLMDKWTVTERKKFYLEEDLEIVTLDWTKSGESYEQSPWTETIPV